ncbi:Piso0_000908 [Millerozyma farinosa CBS 7064]|uniref:Endosomal/vacuolar adapter protein YPT35 n=1 Tax=Pichia sorbitophila (strain ATCC MYA-4447 / BCRC 22081 / CBS 7064 / NBRC 10061 / NRRL Y-12695) TaxID=559304 RepID=G8YRV1_PICSO|nr:Piso0_000908 [Millerozyma farinosa CBS 7064]
MILALEQREKHNNTQRRPTSAMAQMNRDRIRKHSVSQLNKILPVPIQLEDHTHSSNSIDTSHITDVLVGDYHIIEGQSGPSYVVWGLRIVLNGATHSSILIYKRYSELEALRRDLVKHHPDVTIPPLPSKGNFSLSRVLMSPQWLEERRKGLQWFMTNILLNPKLSSSPVITRFILH